MTSPSRAERIFLVILLWLFGLMAIGLFGAAIVMGASSVVQYLHTGTWSPMTTLELANSTLVSFGESPEALWAHWIGLQNMLRSMPAFLSAFVGSVAFLWLSVAVVNS